MLRDRCKRIPRRSWMMLLPLGLGGLYFYLLERIAPAPRYLLHARLDDIIPFVSAFVIPYVLWYFYVAGIGWMLFLKDADEFVRYAAFLSSGMIIACLIYTIWPNGQMLRPDLSSPNGPLEAILGLIYSIDTPTNSAPSLHVMNAIGAHIALSRFNHRRWHSKALNLASLLLALLMVLSTVFVKQHSVICIASGLLLALILAAIIYLRPTVKSIRIARTERAAYGSSAS